MNMMVMVCTGHFSHSFTPSIKGQEKFKGNCIHSHHYRRKDLFRNKKILVVGAGPSAVDISSQLALVAKKVCNCLVQDSFQTMVLCTVAVRK